MIQAAIKHPIATRARIAQIVFDRPLTGLMGLLQNAVSFRSTTGRTADGYPSSVATATATRQPLANSGRWTYSLTVWTSFCPAPKVSDRRGIPGIRRRESV